MYGVVVFVCGVVVLCVCVVVRAFVREPIGAQCLFLVTSSSIAICRAIVAQTNLPMFPGNLNEWVAFGSAAGAAGTPAASGAMAVQAPAKRRRHSRDAPQMAGLAQTQLCPPAALPEVSPPFINSRPLSVVPFIPPGLCWRNAPDLDQPNPLSRLKWLGSLNMLRIGAGGGGGWGSL